MERLTIRKLEQARDTLWIMRERALRNGATQEADLIGRVMGCIMTDRLGIELGKIKGTVDEKLHYYETENN